MEVVSVFSEKFAKISEVVHNVLLENADKEGEIHKFKSDLFISYWCWYILGNHVN